MNTFYFNTGVKPSNVLNFPYEYHKSIGNVIRGTLLIPFDCEAPADAEFLFACSNPDLPNASYPNVLVCKMHNTTMLSEFAYFRVKV